MTEKPTTPEQHAQHLANILIPGKNMGADDYAETIEQERKSIKTESMGRITFPRYKMAMLCAARIYAELWKQFQIPDGIARLEVSPKQIADQDKDTKLTIGIMQEITKAVKQGLAKGGIDDNLATPAIDQFVADNLSGKAYHGKGKSNYDLSEKVISSTPLEPDEAKKASQQLDSLKKVTDKAADSYKKITKGEKNLKVSRTLITQELNNFTNLVTVFTKQQGQQL